MDFRLIKSSIKNIYDIPTKITLKSLKAKNRGGMTKNLSSFRSTVRLDYLCFDHYIETAIKNHHIIEDFLLFYVNEVSAKHKISPSIFSFVDLVPADFDLICSADKKHRRHLQKIGGISI